MSEIGMDVTIEKIKELVAKHALCAESLLSEDTRLGEDLKIIGDDAEELLAEFSSNFEVDMSNMKFNDYFPDEGTSEMHYYLTAIAGGENKNNPLRFLKVLESRFWELFAKKTSFKTVTIRDLLTSAKKGKW